MIKAYEEEYFVLPCKGTNCPILLTCYLHILYVNNIIKDIKSWSTTPAYDKKSKTCLCFKPIIK